MSAQKPVSKSLFFEVPVIQITGDTSFPLVTEMVFVEDTISNLYFITETQASLRI